MSSVFFRPSVDIVLPARPLHRPALTSAVDMIGHYSAHAQKACLIAAVRPQGPPARPEKGPDFDCNLTISVSEARNFSQMVRQNRCGLGLVKAHLPFRQQHTQSFTFTAVPLKILIYDATPRLRDHGKDTA